MDFPPESHQLIDRETALSRLDGDQALINELVQIFLEDAPQLVSKILEGLHNSDLGEVEIHAHSLKSASANVGASRLSELCKVIEQLAREGKAEQLEEVRPMLQKTLEETCSALSTAD